MARASVKRRTGAWASRPRSRPNESGQDARAPVGEAHPIELTILALLVLLGRLQRGIQTAIPGAEAFKRPGFDPGSTCFADDESE